MSDQPKPTGERLQHITIEAGHDAPRLFSATYALPLKIYVKDLLVYDSDKFGIEQDAPPIPPL